MRDLNSEFCSIWGPINVVAFNTVVFMLTMAHLKAVLSDPGKVPLPQSRLDFSDLHSLQTSKKTDMEREEWTVSLYSSYVLRNEQLKLFV